MTKIPQRAPNTTVAVPAPKAVAVTPNTTVAVPAPKAVAVRPTSSASKVVAVVVMMIELKAEYERAVALDKNNLLRELTIDEIERKSQILERYSLENGIYDLVTRELALLSL